MLSSGRRADLCSLLPVCLLSLSLSLALSHFFLRSNTINMKLVLRMLAAVGFPSVAQAWNGAEAVEKIVVQKQHFDLILMDNIMPIQCGPQACRDILQHYKEDTAACAQAPPVIIALTASCMESDRQVAMDSGHSDFIAKPLNLAILTAKLAQWARHIATSAGNTNSNSATSQTSADADMS